MAETLEDIDTENILKISIPCDNCEPVEAVWRVAAVCDKCGTHFLLLCDVCKMEMSERLVASVSFIHGFGCGGVVWAETFVFSKL